MNARYLLLLMATFAGNLCSWAEQKSTTQESKPTVETTRENAEVTRAAKGERSDRDEAVSQMRARRSVQPLPGYLWSEKVDWSKTKVEEPDFVHGHDAHKGSRLIIVDRKPMDGNEDTKPMDWGNVFLCYSETKGVTLRDPKSQWEKMVHYIKDSGGEFFHPLDSYIRSLDATRTPEFRVTSEEWDRLWRLEMDRDVHAVLNLKFLPEEERAQFIALSKLRMDYCEAQARLMYRVIRSTVDGTGGHAIGSVYAEKVRLGVLAQVAEMKAAMFELDLSMNPARQR